jgi:hypothetical protein
MYDGLPTSTAFCFQKPEFQSLNLAGFCNPKEKLTDTEAENRAERFRPEFSQLIPLPRKSLAISSYGLSCELSPLCPQMLRARVSARTGVLASFVGDGRGGEGLICP